MEFRITRTAETTTADAVVELGSGTRDTTGALLRAMRPKGEAPRDRDQPGLLRAPAIGRSEAWLREPLRRLPVP